MGSVSEYDKLGIASHLIKKLSRLREQRKPVQSQSFIGLEVR
jgi:hypothetical protein